MPNQMIVIKFDNLFNFIPAVQFPNSLHLVRNGSGMTYKLELKSHWNSEKPISRKLLWHTLCLFDKSTNLKPGSHLSWES